MASTQAPPEGSAHSHRPYANPIDPSLSPDKLAQLNPLHNAFAGSSALLQDPANAALLQNGGLGYSQGYYTSDPGLYTGQSASRGLFNYAGIRFLTVALSNPFEVGQTLLQVQHLPSDTELTVDGVAALPESTGGRDGGFDRHHGQFTGWVWEMAQLFIQPTLEGYLNEMFNLYDDTIPLMHLDHVWPNLSTLIASNVITGVALSPLELVRTRLMLQPGQTNRQKYSGLFNGLSTIMREEGGLWAMYFSTVHLIPTVVFHSLRPLFENTGSLVVNRALGISSEDTPFTSAVAHMAYSMLELLVVLPVETVRKRLQAQPRYTKEFMLTWYVPITPVPYTGMLNCAYRIITEEGRSAKQIRAARKAMDPSLNSSNNSGRHDPLQEHDGGASRFNRRRPTSATPLPVTWGLRGLYQGFGLHCTSHVALFLVNLVGPITVEEDW
ncbi:mitochondrial carrier domain-containing protein [Dimargaris cristalligena]|uniref:Mitochondrial carrier domain-containing protein n=1 Tax=Dimargaris cristalligena TaxID=215637 RepID=A0A4P9ZX04_9FUNG|nr:mitochondrial carrier domain-containing protein [Dimargaris cristalligena]|eukprot:RKP38206.1 mitochondrial carrier domain-containing protein [Dimargaris cristalligena]